MAFVNNMTNLINKIENRLGLKMLKLPDNINKNTWADEVIIPDTLITFSRYYPHQIKYPVTKDSKEKDGYIYIDESFVDNFQILGVKDIDWTTFAGSNLYAQQTGYGILDYGNIGANLAFEDICDISMIADYNSIINSNIYIRFEPPNRFTVEGIGNSKLFDQLGNFFIYLLVVHQPDLTTISPTMMEVFENLAIADVAGFLYHSLKYFNELEIGNGPNIDLKLDYLEQKAGERDSIIETIKDSYVSASNSNQPLILTI